jgi:pyruvate formate lyase activating enzyme
VTVCPTGAIHWIGERRTAENVMQAVRRDAPFYADGGGMTLTGGEPTMQPDMAEALLRLAKAEGISTAMETCGHTQRNAFERLLPYLDNILFDVKHVDNDIHQSFTGIGNDLILSNLRRLADLNAPITIRVPLIPGFNATPAGVQTIARFVLSLNGGVNAIDLLPYHTLSRTKYKALGREYPWEGHQRLVETEVDALARIFETQGLTVNIGG